MFFTMSHVPSSIRKPVDWSGYPFGGAFYYKKGLAFSNFLIGHPVPCHSKTRCLPFTEPSVADGCHVVTSSCFNSRGEIVASCSGVETKRCYFGFRRFDLSSGSFLTGFSLRLSVEISSSCSSVSTGLFANFLRAVCVILDVSGPPRFSTARPYFTKSRELNDLFALWFRNGLVARSDRGDWIAGVRFSDYGERLFSDLLTSE